MSFLGVRAGWNAFSCSVFGWLPDIRFPRIYGDSRHKKMSPADGAGMRRRQLWHVHLDILDILTVALDTGGLRGWGDRGCPSDERRLQKA